MPTVYPVCTRTFSIDEKKGLNLLNPLWCMVGRERFERSTSGLKVINSIMSPIITTRPKDSLLYLLNKVIMP